MTRVLVGVDGSEGSRRAAIFARNIARAFDARLTLLHVIEPHPAGKLGAFDSAHQTWYAGQVDRASEMLADLARELQIPDAERSVGMGYASDVICREAEEMNADLIVVGRNGHRPGPRLMVGSVGPDITAASGRSVTIVQ
jgi:universal stress protein A